MEQQLRYAGVLYPDSALRLLQQELVDPLLRHHSAELDAELKAWLAEHVQQPLTYLDALLVALQHRQCLVGLCCRLNVACLTAPVGDSITIRGARNQATIKRPRPKLDWLPASCKPAVEVACDNVGIGFLKDIVAAVGRMESFNRSYDLEQVLLVRIAYLAAHAHLSQHGSLPIISEDRTSGPPSLSHDSKA